MRTILVDIKKNHPCVSYFQRNTTASKALRNTANFLIRNLMTGLQKEEDQRTSLEQEAISVVMEGLTLANKKRVKPFPMPTKENWMLSYVQLDAILKCTRNEHYYACTSQVNQQALRKTVESWRGYFEALRKWKKSPQCFTGMPKIPGYIHDAETTARWTNQVVKDTVNDKGQICLKFSTCKELFVLGHLPGKLVQVEVKPLNGFYRMYVTYQDNIPEVTRPEAPARILGIDPGIDNFLGVAGNFESTPFLIDGHWLKAENQWYNKQRSRLLSELTKGKDSKHSVKTSKRLSSLSRHREQRFRDFFYKTAHLICRKAVSWCVDVIVMGHNVQQKTEIDLGYKTNQTFVTIPYDIFRNILRNVAQRYRIYVVDREESYTSQASFLDRDFIPTYGENGPIAPLFSGRRIKRGLYRSADGIDMNADVNGACNILRKEYPEAFQNVSDYRYLHQTVLRITRNEICGVTKRSTHRSYKKKKAANELAA